VLSVAVGEGVVGHHRLHWPASLRGQPSSGSREDRGGDLAAVVGVDLHVGQARAVIDDDVRELDAP
jgi:hypothetical protein